MIDLKRRNVLRSTLAAAVLTAGAPTLVPPERARARSEHAPFVPDLYIRLIAAEDEARILPGRPTSVWRYRGKVLKGDPRALEFLPGSFLPVMRVRRGQKVRIDLVNELPESTIIHWHGLSVPAPMDGHPRYAIGPRETYVYEFEIVNRAGTYWFHPHPDGRTGKQVYFGMAGLFIVSDDEEAAARLPSGPYDVPLVIQDRTFDGDNQLVYLSSQARGGMMGGGMMAAMMGFLGDRILVNGKPDFVLPVEARAYRLRLLNGSNSRIYKLAWSDGAPVTVIASDGGLLEAPVTQPYVMLAPAARVELWADFSDQPPGSERVLQSLRFDGTAAMGGGMMGGGMMMGMMSGMMSGSSLPDGAPFPILKARVVRASSAKSILPQRLSTIPAPRPQDAVNASYPKIFDITMGMMVWGINGRSFQMEGVTAEETVKLGTSEIWEFRNDAATGMMGMMAHAMHVHGLQYRVLERAVEPQFAAARDSVSAGHLDEGWKDTVLVMPGERVRLLLRFERYDGLYLYHCHMLEHEDSGLMRNYLIKV